NDEFYWTTFQAGFRLQKIWLHCGLEMWVSGIAHTRVPSNRESKGGNTSSKAHATLQGLHFHPPFCLSWATRGFIFKPNLN
ncbi:hypothetical protein, partial [Gordoniibacillus kamchatkensis]|uniref:hypothetical protein n=1 Tax=Gordoniibacillus kamchatkensis TaxID=1590651 RepID=UPI001E33576F